VLLLSGLLNAGYFFPIVIRAFFYPAPAPADDAHGATSDHPEHHPVTGEASPWMVVPLCATAALAIIFGLFPDYPLPVVRRSPRGASDRLRIAAARDGRRSSSRWRSNLRHRRMKQPRHSILLATSRSSAPLALQLLRRQGASVATSSPWDRIPRSYGLFGFVGCVLPSVVSPALGKACLPKGPEGLR
jgi:hypothetical protein